MEKICLSLHRKTTKNKIHMTPQVTDFLLKFLKEFKDLRCVFQTLIQRHQSTFHVTINIGFMFTICQQIVIYLFRYYIKNWNFMSD